MAYFESAWPKFGQYLPESYQDMADRLEIFLRVLKRRSDATHLRGIIDELDAGMNPDKEHFKAPHATPAA